MASKAPSKCCSTGFYHEGEPKGTFSTIYGVETYITGDESLKHDNAIVIICDIYGNKFNNNQLIADQLAAAGFRVYLPDILFGDAVITLDGSFDIHAWLSKHNETKVHGIVLSLIHI